MYFQTNKFNRDLIIYLIVYILCVSFQINLIFNCVVYYSKCPILSPTHTCKKGSVMASLKNTVCNTGRKAISDSGEVFPALVSVSGSTLTCAEHLIIARNNAFSPLVA